MWWCAGGEKEDLSMAALLPCSILQLLNPREKYIWAPVRILRETDKAILIYNGMKVWIPKSKIWGIRLRKNVFEIYINEGAVT